MDHGASRMTEETGEILDLERALAEALRAEDPARALARLRADGRFGPEIAARLARVDDDGFRIAALLVARLRFERLMQGSPRASQWFDDDPADFAAAFRRYHAEVTPTAHFPAGEAELFAAWADALRG